MARPPQKIRRKPPVWLTKKRADRKAGIVQYESSLTRQSRVLEQHEKRVADHTALQSGTAILSLIVSVATTLVLIWVAYMQYKTADRQVKLEYAKVEPSFDLVVEIEPTTYIQNSIVLFDMPKRVRVIASRGDAVVTSVQYSQDAGVYRRTDGKTGERCQVEIASLLTGSGSAMDAAVAPMVSNAASSQYLRGPINSYTTVHMDTLWVNITYRDIFDQEKRRLLRYDNGVTSAIASGDKERLLGEAYTVVPAIEEGRRSGMMFRGVSETVPKECNLVVRPPIT